MADSSGTSKGSFKIVNEITYNSATGVKPLLVVMGISADCYEKGTSKYLHGTGAFYASESYKDAFKAIKAQARLTAERRQNKPIWGYSASIEENGALKEDDAQELLGLILSKNAWDPVQPSAVRAALQALAGYLKKGGSIYTSIAVSPLGCEGGGLSYYDANDDYPGVSDMIKEALADYVAAGNTVYLLPTSSTSANGVGGIFEDDELILNYELRQDSQRRALDRARAVVDLENEGMLPPEEQQSLIAVDLAKKIESDKDSKILPGSQEYSKILEQLVAEYDEKYKAALSAKISSFREKSGESKVRGQQLLLGDYYDILAEYQEREDRLAELAEIINKDLDYAEAIREKKRELTDARAALSSLQEAYKLNDRDLNLRVQVRSSELGVDLLETELAALQQEAADAPGAQAEYDRLIAEKAASPDSEKERKFAKERIEKIRPSSRRVTSMRVGRPEIERYKQACEAAEKATDKVDEAERAVELALAHLERLQHGEGTRADELLAELVKDREAELSRAQAARTKERDALREAKAKVEKLERDGEKGMRLEAAKSAVGKIEDRVKAAETKIEALREKVAASGEEAQKVITDALLEEYNKWEKAFDKARESLRSALIDEKNAQGRVVLTRKEAARYIRSATWSADSLSGYKELKERRVNEASTRLEAAKARLDYLKKNPPAEPTLDYALRLQTAKEDLEIAEDDLRYVERKRAKKMRFATSDSDITLTKEQREDYLKSLEDREKSASGPVTRPEGIFQARVAVGTETNLASAQRKISSLAEQISDLADEQDRILRRYELLGGDAKQRLIQQTEDRIARAEGRLQYLEGQSPAEVAREEEERNARLRQKAKEEVAAAEKNLKAVESSPPKRQNRVSEGLYALKLTSAKDDLQLAKRRLESLEAFSPSQLSGDKYEEQLKEYEHQIDAAVAAIDAAESDLRRYLSLADGDADVLALWAESLAGENLLNPREHARARNEFLQITQGADILLMIADLEREKAELEAAIQADPKRYGTLEAQVPVFEAAIKPAEEKYLKEKRKYDRFGEDFENEDYREVLRELNETKYGEKDRSGFRLWQMEARRALSLGESSKDAAKAALVKRLLAAVVPDCKSASMVKVCAAVTKALEFIVSSFVTRLNALLKAEDALVSAESDLDRLKAQIASRGGALYRQAAPVAYTKRATTAEEDAYWESRRRQGEQTEEDRKVQERLRKEQSMTPLERVRSAQRAQREITAAARPERTPAKSIAELRARIQAERAERAAARTPALSPTEVAVESDAAREARMRREERERAEALGYASAAQMRADQARNAPEAVLQSRQVELARVNKEIERSERDLARLSPEDRNYYRVVGALDRSKSRRDDITIADILVLQVPELKGLRSERVRDLQDYLNRMEAELGFPVRDLDELEGILRSSGTLPHPRYRKLEGQIYDLDRRIDLLSSRKSNPTVRRSAAMARIEARREERLARRGRRNNPPWSETGSDVLEIFAKRLEIELDAGGLPTSPALEKRRLSILAQLAPQVRVSLPIRPSHDEICAAAWQIADGALARLESGALNAARAETLIDAALNVG